MPRRTARPAVTLLLVCVFLTALLIVTGQPLQLDHKCLEIVLTGGRGKNGGSKQKDKEEHRNKAEGNYHENLRQLLGNPSFVFITAHPQEKGATAVIKSEDDSKVTSLSQDAQCGMIAMHPGGQKCYVTCPDAKRILVVDAEGYSLIKTIETKDEPLGIAASPDGKSVYIAHYKSNYISTLDTGKEEIVSTIAVKDRPACVAISFDGNRAYVGHAEYVDFDKIRPKDTAYYAG